MLHVRVRQTAWLVLGMASAMALGCDSPSSFAANIQRRITHAGEVVSAPSRAVSDASQIVFTWQVRTSSSWDGYCAQVIRDLAADFELNRKDAQALSLSRHVDGDVYRITFQNRGITRDALHVHVTLTATAG